MARRNKHLSVNTIYEPPRCWVGDTHKIIFATEEEAEAASKVAAYDHHLSTPPKPYKCPYGDHWHLSSN